MIWEGHSIGIGLTPQPPALTLIIDGFEQVYPLTDLLVRLKAKKSSGEPSQSDLTVQWVHPRGKAVLYLSSLQGNEEEAGPKLTYVSGDMFLAPR